jgi:peptidoglycan/LPS O-acetylase OafA/YrhL
MLISLTKIESPHLALELTLSRFILNLMIVPLNFYMFFDISKYSLIPQAWALGNIVLFYWLVPIILKNYKICQYLTIFSMIIFSLASFNIIPTDYYGYRLIPGTLFIFLCGSYLYDNLRTSNYMIIFIASYVFIIFVVLTINGYINVQYNLEALTGIIVGIPIVHFLSRVKQSKFDSFWGNLSYGVFLGHYFIIWLFQAVGQKINTPIKAMLYLMLTMILSAVGFYLFESPVNTFRRKWRREHLYSRPPSALP